MSVSPTSARGQYAAMGHGSAPVAFETGTDLAGAFSRPVHAKRKANDFYPTPWAPFAALARAEAARLRQFETLWEPCCGDGRAAGHLRGFGHDVACSDLIDRGCGAVIRDFLGFTPRDALADAVVTNPPFALCNVDLKKKIDAPFIRHALEVLRLPYMALLLPAGWELSAGKAGLWRSHAPARIHGMAWRVDFTGQGAPPMKTAWYVWDGHTRDGATRISVLDRPRGDGGQACMFSESEAA